MTIRAASGEWDGSCLRVGGLAGVLSLDRQRAGGSANGQLGAGNEEEELAIAASRSKLIDSVVASRMQVALSSVCAERVL